MGSVRTEHIKRVAKELIRRFPNKFSRDFEHNKHSVEVLIRGATPKVRNQIAGYITNVFSRMQPSSSQVENTESG